ncbi:MAG: hypothetical protein QNK18_10860 [Gammaproteobacteria bacterium]|nr:hypothetical protein [Gammaproteobacteria bacterium]
MKAIVMTLHVDPEVLRLQEMVVRRPVRDSEAPVWIRAAASIYGHAVDPAERPVSQGRYLGASCGNQTGFFVNAPHVPGRPSNDRKPEPAMSAELQRER